MTFSRSTADLWRLGSAAIACTAPEGRGDATTALARAALTAAPSAGQLAWLQQVRPPPARLPLTTGGECATYPTLTVLSL